MQKTAGPGCLKVRLPPESRLVAKIKLLGLTIGMATGGRVGQKNAPGWHASGRKLS
jgi:hypothetical protein